VLGGVGCEVECVRWCWVLGSVCWVVLCVRYSVLGGFRCEVQCVGWCWV